MNLTPIEPGNCYHIYNKGINGCDIFVESENYSYFLRLYEKYIDPIAETYAWCILGNYFHILLRIKEFAELTDQLLINSLVDSETRYNPSKYFSHLFNAYSQAFNKRYERTGSLFTRPFRRKLVDNEKYLRQLIFYIHHNPVKHGFVQTLSNYQWTSFQTILSSKPTIISREKVIGYFDDLENFRAFHSSKIELESIKEFIIEE